MFSEKPLSNCLNSNTFYVQAKMIIMRSVSYFLRKNKKFTLDSSFWDLGTSKC